MKQVVAWIEVTKASQLPPGTRKTFKIGRESITVFNLAGSFYAVDNTCPHQGGPLGEGQLDGEVVTCPWHAWKYNVRTGCAVLTPSVRTYVLRESDGGIEIAIPASGSLEEAAVVPEEDPAHLILEQIQLGKTLDEVFESLYTSLQSIVPHSRLGLALLDPGSGKLVQVKTRSDRNILLDDGFSAPLEGTSLERILELGEPRILDDLGAHLSRRPSAWTRLLVEEGMRSSLTLPLKVQGRQIGLIFLSSVVPGAFKEEHAGFLQRITGQLSILIEKGAWVSELARSNERYRMLFEMSNEGVFLCPSPDEPFVTVNENLAAWLGYHLNEMMSLSLADLLPDYQVEPIRNLLRLGGTQLEPVVFEAFLRKKGGGTLPVDLRARSVAHRGKTFIHGFARDLSEVEALRVELEGRYSFENLVGKNPMMRAVYTLIEQVAPMDTTVLIQGESGTGKELVARAIHRHSERGRQKFVTVNCAALVETLLESELFGHVRGAFTGAGSGRVGRFELAHGGTVFLDEIGDLSPAMQVKLLRILQEGEFEKVGSSITRKVDVRIIAATNRDLRTAIKTGSFREDLYYRLNVVTILLPPLRDRRDDIPLLVRHFIEKYRQKTGKAIRDITGEALDLLMEYSFPGNVRQLENIIEHAFVRCQGGAIDRRHLPSDLTAYPADLVSRALAGDRPLMVIEREIVQRVLEQCGGKPKLAAERLGISRVTLWRKLKRQPKP